MPYNLVLDASAVIKWFIREDEYTEMCEIRDLFIEGKLEIYIPSLLFTEFINALRYTSGITAGDVVKALNALKTLRLNVVNDLDLLPEAVEIAFNADITVYDAIYVALAKATKSKLITYDAKLLSKFDSLAMRASQILKQIARRET
ncbi:MAG: type II toxin-antitoxin system VapC family toxin [Candidatus Bathyarchaeia archaeon]